MKTEVVADLSRRVREHLKKFLQIQIPRNDDSRTFDNESHTLTIGC